MLLIHTIDFWGIILGLTTEITITGQKLARNGTMPTLPIKNHRARMRTSNCEFLLFAHFFNMILRALAINVFRLVDDVVRTTLDIVGVHGLACLVVVCLEEVLAVAD